MRISRGAAKGAWLLALAAAVVAGLAAAAEPAAPGDLLAQGRTLYLEGRRADGSPLRAARAGGQAVSGAEAACVSCHRRSGLGGAEGRNYIPPVTASALFTAMPRGKGPSALGDGRPAYDVASLAHALREGVDASGRRLDFLMPRYALREQEVLALEAYLRSLADAPAAAESVLHFATVIAPEVPPERAAAMTGVLQACFDEHNAGPQPEQGRHKLAPGMRQREGRPWQLHVWHLQGTEDSWEAQLVQRAREQPVFALVGGVGGARWAPVEGFCERAGLPCLFPHLEAPTSAAAGFYPFYLGQGVLLEAALVARHLAPAGASARVTQVLRAHDAAAEAAATALRQALQGQGVATRELRLGPGEPLAPQAGSPLQAQDTLVLWLRPDDLQRLGAQAPPAAQVIVSATLAARDDVPLPEAWRARALMAYPFELPQLRAARVAPLRQWLQARGLPLAQERVQADAFVACRALRTALLEAEDHLGRDYLVERLEVDMERSTATGLYPRLTLGIGQRFASKSGYLVRFDGPAGALAAVGERMAP